MLSYHGWASPRIYGLSLVSNFEYARVSVMDNKDVQSGIDNIIDFISTLWNGVEAAIDVIPPIVLGFIVIVLIVIWAWHKVSN